ncbi:MAG: spore coat protein CotJB [Clostridia bacterium]|nr:spore coat protein CotJB [Clostridia bacterium]
MDNCALLKNRIGAYQFAIWEMTLYLDTHPCSECALAKLYELRQMKDRLVAEYEAQYGPWVMTSNDVQGERWTWVDGPWPWEGRGGN